MKKHSTRFQLLLCLVGLALSARAQSWHQTGSDMDGEAGGDQSGWSVSMPDPYTVAIGAKMNDGAGVDVGHVRVYAWDALAGAWVQKGADMDGEADYDESGFSVSMPDANTVAIGSIWNFGAGTGEGHVRVYAWSGSAWVQKGGDIDGEAAGDQSGYSVSMPDANTVAIGAIYNGGGGANAGHVRVYAWSGSAWVQKGTDIDGEAPGDYAGFSVSMPDASTLAVGAHWNDGAAVQAGHVRVYAWSGTAWVQKGTDMDGEAAGDYAGWSVSMPDASTVAIGAPFNDGAGAEAGHVRVYAWSGTAWVQKGADIDGEAAGDNSGLSVSMPDASTVAIGAWDNDGAGSYAGHVRVYAWSGSAWVQQGPDIDGEAAGDESGISVSMPDASTVAIGATSNDEAGAFAGHVRVFNFCSPSTASLTATACDSYTSPSGAVYTASGTYSDTITNVAGCDSIITLNLTVTVVDVSVSVSGGTLTSNAVGASYQWLDCGSGLAVVPGATDSSYTPATSGSYAVAVTMGGCTDTSACEMITGRLESTFAGSVAIYPNPSSSSVTLQASFPDQGHATITVYNATGMKVATLFDGDVAAGVERQFSFSGEPGIYFVTVAVSQAMHTEKVVILR